MQKSTLSLLFSFFLYCGSVLAQAPFLNGSAYSGGSNCYVLTNAVVSQKGSVWFTQQLNLNNPFDLQFMMNFGINDGGGGDGMTFVLQRSGTNAIGSTGGTLGYSGIAPSLAVEFDTYQNAVYSDPLADHLAVVVNGNLNHTLANNIAGPVSATSSMGNIEDGIDHRVRIKWNPVYDSLHVYFDCELRLAIQYNMRTTVFSVNPMVWWGFTASGGGAFNRQGVCILPTAPAFIRDTTICRGDTVQLVAPAGTNYFWSPATGVSNSNVVNPKFFPALTTRYYVQFVDECNQTILDSVLVNVASVSLNLGADTNLCYGRSILLVADSGYSAYIWQNGSMGSILTASASGFYAVGAIDGRGCYGYDSVYVHVLPPLSLSVLPGSPVICAGDSIVLNGIGGATYDWFPSLGLSNQAGVSVTASPPSTTNYRVLATDSFGCIDSLSFLLTVNQLPVVQISRDTSICFGASTTLSASGGIRYVWSPADSLSDSNIDNPFANPANSTTYSVFVTDGNGCTSSRFVMVGVNPLPTVSITPDTAICIGSSVQLSVTGGINYSWSPAAGLNDASSSNPVASPFSSTGYSVTATDLNGCSSIDGLTVTVNQLPVVTMIPDTAICTGGNIQLMASGGVFYSWNPSSSLSNSTVSNPVANPFIRTDYVVTVTDAAGCVNQGVTQVDVHADVQVIIATNQHICFGTTAQLLAGGGIDYSWSPVYAINNPSVSNPIASPDSTTTYVVHVTDANGCTGIGSTTVTVNQLPVIAMSVDTAVCFGSSVPLFSTGGIGFSWSPLTGLSNPNISNPVVAPLSTTEYSVMVTDANGCSSSDSLMVIVNQLPVVTILPDTAICTGSNIQLMATGGIAYAWSPSASLNNATVSNPIASPVMQTNYVVSVTDAAGCINQGTTHVDLHPVVQVIIVPDQSICFGSSTQLVASGGSSYSWSPDSGLSNSLIPNPVANPAITTMYVVSATDANGCAGNGTTTVNVNPLPIISINSDTAVCQGSSAQLVSSGGTSYSWNPTVGLSNPAIPNPLAAPSSTTLYSVLVMDALGCSSSSGTTVSVHPLTAINAMNDTSICIGSSIQLAASASGGLFYSWSPSASLNNSTVSNPVASPANSTVYSVTVTDTNGCSNNGVSRVDVLPYVNASVMSDQNICIGSNTQLIASGGSVYSWHPATGLDNPGIANPVANPVSTITYTVQVSETNKCSGSGQLTVHVLALPEITVTSDTIIPFGSTIQLVAEGGSFYSWFPGDFLNCIFCDRPMATPSNDMEYVVTVMDSNGCENRKAVKVRLEDVFTLIVPNAFTPGNQDGRNDVLYADGIGIKEFRIVIYNRWGKLVFESDDINKGWDGTLNGQLVQDGVYVYYANVVSYSGKSTSRSGSITLIK